MHNEKLPLILMSITLIGVTLLGDLAYGQESRPNIIYIISDDQAWTDYGFMGHPYIETPHIDKLAHESLTFTRGYVTAPLCSPSLASIITGLYPQQHRITGNDPTFESKEKRYSKAWQLERKQHYREYLDEFQKHPTVPALLKEKGYLSLQTGKWWGDHWKEGGFTHGMTHGDAAKGGRHGDEGLVIGREGMEPIYDFIGHAIQEDKPFMVWYAPFLPHTPHNPPDSLYHKYLPNAPTDAVAKYWAMCEWLDVTVGQLMGYLEENGLTDNTLVIYVTDNGWIQDPEVSNKYMAGSKQDPQDGGIRTPIMFKWPGHINPNIDTVSLVSSVDIAATTLAAVGLKPLQQTEGINVRDQKKLKARKKIFSVDFAHDMVHVDQPQKSLENRMVITNPWKLILPESGQDRQVQLYHIYNDPLEKENLADKNPRIIKKLKAQLEKWWASTVSADLPGF